MSVDPSSIRFRALTPKDGAAIHQLVCDSRVLDVNSPYAYLLIGEMFGHTSIIAEDNDELVGFVASFRPPKQPDVIFVWQVAVAKSARGQGLGRRLLDELVQLEGCRGVRFMEATVTPSNQPSRALFRSFAAANGARCDVTEKFTADLFPGVGHEPEELFRIGPLSPPG